MPKARQDGGSRVGKRTLKEDAHILSSRVGILVHKALRNIPRVSKSEIDSVSVRVAYLKVFSEILSDTTGYSDD